MKLLFLCTEVARATQGGFSIDHGAKTTEQDESKQQTAELKR
jgi:hypothetical protein